MVHALTRGEPGALPLRATRRLMSELARSTFSVIAGCLVGGAVGEALGRQAAERAPAGIVDGPAGTIGWHTQLTMVTADGLLRAHNRLLARGFADMPSVVYLAYRRWLVAQGDRSLSLPGSFEHPESSWLLRLPALTEPRGASETTLAALRAGGVGRPGHAINDSEDSSAITHLAPVGLLPPDVDVGRLGMEVAALTHGSAIAQFAAGAVAIVIHRLMARRGLEAALGDALAWLDWARRERQDGAALAPLVAALRRVVQAEVGDLEATVRAGALGAGQSAAEALAIAVAGARCAGDFEHGVQLAAGHGGARDATGTLAGQILGATLGVASVPHRWLDRLDARDALMELADDWDRHFFGGGARDQAKYPGY
jgi:ADP-ribosylglycohydrolase